MNSIPGETKLKALQALISTCSPEEIIWMNGYLSAVIAMVGTNAQEQPAARQAVSKITLVYGTETGNAKKLATGFAAKAKKLGIHARLTSLDQYKLSDLVKEDYFFAIISTHGDGEPPAAARKFFDYIHEHSPDLSTLKFSVLALGDTSYPLFCKTGEDVDQRLLSLGAHQVLALQKCDIDFEEDANAWFNGVLRSLQQSTTASTAPPVANKKSTGRKTFARRVLTNINLNDIGSRKETYHIEIEAEDIVYLPGDSIGVIPENPVAIVEAILAMAGIERDRAIGYKNEQVSILELLQRKLSIFYLPERVVKQYAAIVQQDIPLTRIDLADLLKLYPVNNPVQFKDVINILEPITPRLYSIASSPEAHSAEIHIIVAKNSYDFNNEVKYGLASDFLSHLQVDATLNFYLHPNAQFRLPDDDKDVIMIGPGTGIAPFRSFIAQRDATGASGKNWLFFGDQHFHTDFLYQTEIQNWLETGVLTKINVAFSRDSEEKVYVQHKMMRERSDFYQWLENGAVVYICGTKEPMSVDVEQTILRIIGSEGNRTPQEALQYLDQMKEDGRYLKDVY